jgi:hypothetical protein
MPVFPVWGAHLVVADDASRAAARDVVRRLQAGGGTAMSTWLHLAREMFAASPTDLQHVILLTDGENREEPTELHQELARCRGAFQADCRGVGTDWSVDELRTIAAMLLGTVDIVPEPELLADEFRSLMERAMGRAVANAALQVRCPKGVGVNFVRQVSPEVRDLTEEVTPVDERTLQFPLGAWGAEARDYHLSLAVPPNGVGVEMLAARVSLATDDTTVGPALVRAVWTDDEAYSARISPEVAHYQAQADLSADIQAGLGALRSGDERTATVRLARATKAAVESGHEGTVRLLRKVIDVEGDGVRSGTVRLRPRIEKADEMALDTRSTMTVRVRPGQVKPGAAAAGAAPGAGSGAAPAAARSPASGGDDGDDGDEMALDTRTSMTVRTRSRRPRP